MGSVCKAQGRIHRALLKPDYYRIRRHENKLQSSIRTKIWFRGFAPLLRVASHCPYHCRARVAQEIRGILTYRCPHLPPRFQGSPYIVLSHSGESVSKCRYGSRSLYDLT